MGGSSVMIGTRLGTGPITMVAMKPYSLSVVAPVVECAASAKRLSAVHLKVLAMCV